MVAGVMATMPTMPTLVGPRNARLMMPGVLTPRWVCLGAHLHRNGDTVRHVIAPSLTQPGLVEVAETQAEALRFLCPAALLGSVPIARKLGPSPGE